MAKYADRLPANVDGALFVDANCIDCSTCRWIAPALFDAAAGYSRVYRQPKAAGDWADAARALIACPTGAIASREKRPETRADPYPERIAGEVYYCGYHSAASFGAASYLIRTGDANILVDSPRFARRLVNRIEALGGISIMFLTHRDDVADHEKFAQPGGDAYLDAHVDQQRQKTDEQQRVEKDRAPWTTSRRRRDRRLVVR